MVVIIESYVQLELKGRFSDLHTERFRSWGTKKRLFSHFQPLHSPPSLHAGLLCSEGCLDLGWTDRQTNLRTKQSPYPVRACAHRVTKISTDRAITLPLVRLRARGNNGQAGSHTLTNREPHPFNGVGSSTNRKPHPSNDQVE